MGILFLIAPILFAVMIGVPVGLLLWFAKFREKQEAKRKGFEVTPTDETPVGSEKERDNDHG